MDSSTEFSNRILTSWQHDWSSIITKEKDLGISGFDSWWFAWIWRQIQSFQNKLELLGHLVWSLRSRTWNCVCGGGHLLRHSENPIQCSSTSKVAVDSSTAFDEFSTLNSKSTRSWSLREQLNFLQSSTVTFYNIKNHKLHMTWKPRFRAFFWYKVLLILTKKCVECFGQDACNGLALREFNQGCSINSMPLMIPLRTGSFVFLEHTAL
jgi:hypothetical protein